MKKLTEYIPKLFIVFYILVLTSCSLFSRKSITEEIPLVGSTINDNVTSCTLNNSFSVKDPIFKMTINSSYLSRPILHETFASWINNFKLDFTKILESKKIYDNVSNQIYIIPEFEVKPNVKELLDCDTYIPYIYKKCEKKYFVYINGELTLNFYKEFILLKKERIDFAKLGIPNIVETTNIEDINKKAINLMDKIYIYLIDNLSKNDSIYCINNKEDIK